jgi:hypothetical protein
VRCSRCSETVRPVVAIDIDGTLGDYHGHFEEFAEQWLGRERFGSAYDGDLSHGEWFERAFGVDRTTFRAIKLAFRQGGFKRFMPVFPHARPLVNSLRDLAEVWLTTARPWDRFDRVDPDTREWLRRGGFEYHGLLYSDDKMAALAERVDPERVVFVLDDLRDVLERATSFFPSAGIVRRLTEYNSGDYPWSVETSDLLDEFDALPVAEEPS